MKNIVNEIRILWKVIIVLLVLSIPNSSFGQEPGGGDNRHKPTAIVPPSPTAATFAEYGNFPVNMANGTANISIPLYSFSGDGLSVPLSLSYHSGGTKVDEISSWVGLGWSLNGGGVITRSVMGRPDELSFGYMHMVEQINESFENNDLTLSFLENIDGGVYDGDPDQFNFNFGNYSGKFVFVGINEIKTIPQQDLIIEPFYVSGNHHINSFKVTTPEGIQYTFDKKEYSLVENYLETGGVSDCVNLAEYPNEFAPTAWYLSNIFNPNTNDNIALTYEAHSINYDQANFANHTFRQMVQELWYCSHPASGSPLTSCTGYSKKTENGLHLQTISGKYGSIEFIAAGERLDLLGGNGTNGGTNRLSEIHIKGAQGALLKKYVFTQAWTESTENLDVPNEHRKFRMYLESVQEIGSDGISKPPYSFDYHNRDLLPARLSYSQDHWGYYNGADNDVMIPDSDYEGLVYTDMSAYTGADRETNVNYANYGLLKKITYPTSGTTEFEYEGHQYTSNEPVPEVLPFTEGAVAIQSCDHNQTNNCDLIYNESSEFTLINPQNVILFRQLQKQIPQNNGPIGAPEPTCGLIKFDTTTNDWVDVPLVGDFHFILGNDGITLTAEIWNHQNSMSFPISLTGGTYKLWAESGLYISQARINLWCDTETGNETYPEIKAGGARIARMESSPNTPDPEVIVTYEYEPFYFSGARGANYDRLEDYKVKTGDVDDQDSNNTCGSHDCKQVSLTSNGLGGSQVGNLVSYRQVNEIYPDNGKTRNDFSVMFNTPPTLNDHPLSPFIGTVWVDNSWGRGKLLHKTVFDENETILAEEINEYDFFNETNNLTLYGLNARYVYYEHCQPFLGGPLVNYAYEYYRLFSNRVILENSQSIVYDQNGENPITTSTTYAYGSDHTNPLKIIMSGGGVSQITDITYAHEADAAEHPVATEMVARNMVSIPLETTVTGTIQSGGKTVYTLHEDMILPLEFHQQMGSSELQLVGTLSYTDNDPFPDEYQKANDPANPEIYNWYPAGSTKEGLLASKKYIGWTQTFDYHSNSRLLTSQQDIDGQVISYDYDGLQRLETITAREGAVITENGYSYGPGSNSISSTTTFTDGTSPQSTKQYFDGLGRGTRTFQNGVIQEKVKYDNIGRVAENTYLPGTSTVTKYTYEPSPLNRALIETYPDESTVLHHHLHQGGLRKKGVTDENGNTSYSLTNILGQLKRQTNALSHSTIYSYDPYGNIEEVTAPNGEIYKYDYDDRSRLVEKTVPGAGIQKFSYNNRDLLVASQDENLKADGRWLATSYDSYGRPTTSGFYSGTPGNLNNLSPQEILTETYYDSYNNVPDIPNMNASCTGGGAILTGKVVGTKVNIMDGKNLGSEYTYTLNCIDDFGRVEIMSSNNHLSDGSGWDEISNTLDLADNILVTDHRHNAGEESISITNTFSYDNFFRRTKAWHQINGGANRLVSWDNYNNAGQLVNKYLGYNENAVGSAPQYLQRMSYDYNIRGWLTSINDVDALKDIPVAECDVSPPIPPICPRACDYTLKFNCGNTGTTVVGISVGGGRQSIRLNNVPCENILEIEQIIEDWLDTNGYMYDDVIVSNPNGIVTITIFASKIPFDDISIAVPNNNAGGGNGGSVIQGGGGGRPPTNGGGGSTTNGAGPKALGTIRFTRFNCSGVSAALEFPESIVSLCESYGYVAERCPYRTLQDSCVNCDSLGISLPEEDCSYCTPLEVRCEDCESLAYPSCETCPLTVKYIRPTRLQIAYNLNDLNNSNTSAYLIRMMETADFYLHDDSYRKSDRNHILLVGEHPTLSSNELIHDLDIAINDLVVGSENLTVVTTAIEEQVAEELVMAGVDDQAIIDDFTNAVANALAGSWDGPPTTTVPEQQDGYNANIFAMDLFYQEGNDLTQTEGQANGNISGITWGINSGHKQTYGFEYDPINRLEEAKHRMKIDVNEWDENNKYGMSATYDAVGNIMSLDRNGIIEICETTTGAVFYDFGQIDELVYVYGSGNRLGSVTESSNEEHGFKTGGSGYGYDGNGNINSSNKGIFEYNHLNLPYSFSGGGSINWKYDAAGAKLQKLVGGGGQDENYTKDYVLGIEYRDGEIEAIYHPEGRAIYEEEEFIYEYNIKDHLGNVRLTFSDKDDNGYITPFGVYPGGLGVSLGAVNYSKFEGHEVIQENHYYPFGMGMEGSWDGLEQDPAQDYKYGGKELNSDLGLDWADYHNRWYDPSIGRFTSVDKLADHPNQIDKSPYAYAWNDPVGLNDPDGNCPECAKRKVQEGFLRIFNAAATAIDRVSTSVSATVENVIDSVSETFGFVERTEEDRLETTGYAKAEFNVSKFTDPGNYSEANGYVDNGQDPAVDVGIGVTSNLVHVSSTKVDAGVTYYEMESSTDAKSKETTTTYKTGVERGVVSASMFHQPNQNGQGSQSGVELEAAVEVSPTLRFKAKVEINYGKEN